MQKDNADKSKYEVPVVIKPLLPDDIESKVVKKMVDIVKELGGSFERREVWGKKHLAYPINNHQEGYYIFFILEIDPQNVSEVEREFTLISDILKFMVIKEENL